MREGWVEYKFKDIATAIKGKLPKDKNEIGEGIPYLTASYLRSGKPDFWVENLEGLVMAEDGDCLILWDGAGAGDLFSANHGIVSSTMAVVTTQNSDILREFLTLLISSKAEYIKETCRGTTVPHVSPDAIANMDLKIPPLPEQEKIVDLLVAVDSYIKALQHQLDSANRSREAVFYEILTTESDNWFQTNLGEVLEICKNGKNYKDGISSEGLPITRIQTISEGKIDLTKVGFGNLFLEDADGFLLEEGDVLFSHINSLPHVGKVAQVQSIHLPLIHGMNLLRMQFKNTYDHNFMFYLMQSNWMRSEIKSRAQIAVNQVSINISSLKNIIVRIPQLEIQRKIATLIGQWDVLIQECESSLFSVRKLRSGLLSDLLSGEHEIPASYDKVMAK